MNGAFAKPEEQDAAEQEPDTVRLEGFASQDLYAKREKIITRHVDGAYQKLRYYSGWPLLAGYFVTPWLQWGERQAVLFDLPARQFHIFGLTVWPQDLWLLGWMLMIAAFGLFTVTTMVGRLWCGYTCPQTVWTAIFMWVEQLTEGSRNQRMRLDAAPWSWNKLRRRGLKHLMWMGWAAFTGLTFVGYFTPIRELTAGAFAGFDVAALSGWALFWVAFFTLATYVNAGWMREQVCLYMCPYARFQSSMIDRDTLIVSYDAARGDPRGSRKRSADAAERATLGDCIDCQLCVQVCPTGIDIRDGLQYECIGCAHCVDACDQVMAKMGYAPGLVRYTTQNAMEGRGLHILKPRTIGYAAVCCALIVAFGAALLLRAPLDLDVLRDRGNLYSESAAGLVNDYQLKIMNKTQSAQQIEILVEPAARFVIDSDTSTALAAGHLVDVPLRIRARDVAAPITDVRVSVCAQDRCVTETTRFIGPGSIDGARLPGARSTGAGR